MKFTKKLKNLLDNTGELTAKTECKEVSVSHLENQLLNESGLKETFSDLLGENYNTLKNLSESEMIKGEKFKHGTVREMIESGIEVPLRTSEKLHNVLACASDCASFFERTTSSIFDVVFALKFLSLPGSIFTEIDSETARDIVIKMAEIESLEIDEKDISEVEKEFEEIVKDSVDRIAELLNGNCPKREIDWREYVTDMLDEAKKNSKPFIGGAETIESIKRGLIRKDKGNIILKGEPGVGKTAYAQQIAKLIVDGDVPEKLQESKMYSLSVGTLIAGTIYRGEMEERLEAILKGVQEECNSPIVFIDEIHTIVGAGAGGQGNLDVSNIMKPYLTSSTIHFIGATTNSEYKRIESDKALMRRFKAVNIAEPSISDSIEILKGLKSVYEAHHNVSYTEDAITAAAELSAKYILGKFLPDKAIDLIDESGAFYALKGVNKKIDRDDIEMILSDIYKIPKVNEDKKLYETVSKLEENLKKNVFGQNEAVEKFTKAVKLAASGLNEKDKPMGVFLFAGPSGVGKTELAKKASEMLDMKLLRYDMSEYQEAHSVARFIGAPAGYVGHDSSNGTLVSDVKNNPNSIILFDEFEKAHDDISKALLQVFDYGVMTDGKGEKADFRNCIVIMTSNIGATSIAKTTVGFNNSNGDSDMKSSIARAIEKRFAPEFRNRISAVLTFNSINDEIGEMIVKKELNSLADKLLQKDIKVKFTDKCLKALREKGVSPVFGARGIQRTIDEYIKEGIFVDAIINGSASKNYTIDYNRDSDEFITKYKTKA